jgi:Transposase and inactivated derivatives
MKARVEWATKHRYWDFEMWKRVDWTDAASFTTGAFGKIYVTRTVEEKFAPTCLVPKFAGYSSAMAYGAISGIGKGPLILMEKDWGKVSAKVYIERVLPHFYRHLREIAREVGFMRAILMEDNASIHTAKLTKGYHAYHGINRMIWPAHSPDLNPIENVWRLLKYRIGKRFPKTDAEVRQYLVEEWDKLELQDFIKYIESMHERCEAVIEAKGGHTKW